MLAMKPFFSFSSPLALFLLLFSTLGGATGQGLIDETCKKCAQDDPNVLNFCTTSLQAAPASQCASLRGLGMISISLIRYNITDTKCRMKQLLKNKELDPYVKQCLSDCFQLYSDAIPLVKEAKKYYNDKSYFDANVKITAIMDAASTCEEGFKDREGFTSPLTERNNNTLQLCDVALSIMHILDQNGAD